MNTHQAPVAPAGFPTAPQPQSVPPCTPPPSPEENGLPGEYHLAILDEISLQEFHQFLDFQPWDGDSRNHNKAFEGFLRAASLGIDPDVALAAIEERIGKAGGQVDWGDLSGQRRRAYEYVQQIDAGDIVPPPRVPRPEFSPELLRRVAMQVDIADPADYLRRISPVPPTRVTPAGFLEALYRPGEHIVVFTIYKSQGQTVYKVGQSSPDSIPPSGPQGVWFLTQPVDGRRHHNPRTGKPSRRSEESVTAWRYAVLESDKAAEPDWLRMLIQAPLPIEAIYTSGRRSIHATVRVDAETKAEWDAIKSEIAAVMVPYGADPGALTAVRLSRLPQCRRGDRMQELLYLNPGADGTPIFRREEGPDLKP
jgi:hypothetical protein